MKQMLVLGCIGYRFYRCSEWVISPSGLKLRCDYCQHEQEKLLNREREKIRRQKQARLETEKINRKIKKQALASR